MDIIMIACIYGSRNKARIKGFRLLDVDTKQTIDADYKSVLDVLKKSDNIIRNLELREGEAVGSNGSLNRYTSIFNNTPIDNLRTMVVLNTIDDYGYTVANYNGTIVNLTKDKAIEHGDKYGIANGKVVEKNGVKYISSIIDTYKNIDAIKIFGEKIKIKDTTSNKQNNAVGGKTLRKDTSDAADTISKVDSTSKDESNKNYRLPKIHGRDIALESSKLKDIDTDGISVEQKLTKGLLLIRDIKPFYYAMLRSIDKKESIEVPTMGVSIDKLYYNAEFVKNLTIPELVFVLIHEVCHLAMNHTSRCMNRNGEIWNIACDYFINKVIVEELDFNILDLTKPVFTGKNKGCMVKIPEGILLDMNVDTLKDTPESIYNKLMNTANKQQHNYNSNNSNNNNSNSNNSNSNNENDIQNNSEYDKNNQNGANNTSLGKLKEEYRKGYLYSDLVEDESARTSSESSNRYKYETVLKRAKIIEKQENYGRTKGSTSVVEAFVDAELVPKVNWRSIIQNRLIKMTSEEKSLSTPDRRFTYRNMYIEGNKEDEEKAEGIKLCIDTSGSITDIDIAIAFEQIRSLLKTYKVSAEVIFWDTEIQDICNFEDYNGLRLAKNKAKGRGGTDPNCVFELFNSKEYKNGKKDRPELIVIFTDGMFEDIDEKHRKYGKDTIWILNSNTRNFSPPFGRIGKLKYNQ